MDLGRGPAIVGCIVATVGVASCSLITSLDDLRSDAGSVVTDAANDAPTSDAGDAGADVDAYVAPSTAILISAGGQLFPATTGAHACAIVGIDHALYCWGANDHGQLGIGTTGDGGTTADHPTPTKILADTMNAPFSGVDDVTAGSWNTCARKGALMYCWGQREGGGVGDGQLTTIDEPTPINVTGYALAIATGGAHSCYVNNNSGRVTCFGNNHSEQLGHALFTTGDTACSPFFDPSNSACNVTALVANFAASASQVSAGTLHTCALTPAGNVYCWGYQGESATGGGGFVSTPSPVSVMKTGNTPLVLSKLDSTARHNCGLDGAGAVWCWGQNDTGQCGLAPAVGVVTATQVVGLVATDVAVGEHASCAVVLGEVVCWGDDTYGQLGDGKLQATDVPQKVKGPGGTGTLTNVTHLSLAYGFACALTTDQSVYCWGHNDRGQLGDGTTTDRPFPTRVSLP